MASISDELFDEVVEVLLHHLDTEDNRKTVLIPLVRNLAIYNQIKWEGTPKSFTVQLVHLLPNGVLIKLLKKLQVGDEQNPKIDSLCKQLSPDGGKNEVAAISLFRKTIFAVVGLLIILFIPKLLTSLPKSQPIKTSTPITPTESQLVLRPIALPEPRPIDKLVDDLNQTVTDNRIEARILADGIQAFTDGSPGTWSNINIRGKWIFFATPKENYSNNNPPENTIPRIRGCDHILWSKSSYTDGWLSRLQQNEAWVLKNHSYGEATLNGETYVILRINDDFEENSAVSSVKLFVGTNGTTFYSCQAEE